MNYKDIRFRAWHKDKERMYTVVELDFHGNLVLLDYYFVNTPYGVVQEIPFWEPVDEVELMMFTGLQDKHGKDIYEGDIVSYTEYEGDIVSYTEIDGYSWETNRKSRDLVTEITVSIKTEFEEYYGGEDTQISYENIEIIGNKYENPELV